MGEIKEHQWSYLEKSGDNELHLYCLEKSAQAWCKDSTKKLEMIPELAEEFASILFEEISNTIDKGKNVTINEETKKSHLKDLKNYCFHDQILGSHELHKIKQHIVEWRESGSGINSALAQPIVDCILILCQEVRNISIKNTDEELPENHPYHPDHVSENYSKPIQTGVNQWSVFVRKYKGHTDCVGVIEHRFKTEDNAQAFSVNNWNLGEYY